MNLFIWPWLLLLFLVLPFVFWLLAKSLKRSAESALQYSDFAVLKRLQLDSKPFRRLPIIFFILTILLACLALARPTFPVLVADPLGGIILALDTSRSMQQRDIQPNRFEAAREAIRTFVSELPEGTRVGLVSFGSSAQLNIALTEDHDAFLSVLNSMPLIRGTAIGEGLLKSLDALPLSGQAQLGENAVSMGTIVLLSDGNSRSGIAPLEALEFVKEKGVTVYTVGIGTRQGGQGGFGGQAGFDEATLQTIAKETGGRYSFVDSADDLKELYRNLSQSVAWRWSRDEATAIFALAAALLLLLSLVLSETKRRLM